LVVVSEPILAEYRRVLGYSHLRRLHHFTDDEIMALIDNIRVNAQMVITTDRLHVVADDPADDKFVEAAVVGGADFIVSGDRHFLQLRSYSGVRVLTPAAFVTVLDAEAGETRR
jgi:putative PIN family toxin of toxin-antitoxin system